MHRAVQTFQRAAQTFQRAAQTHPGSLTIATLGGSVLAGGILLTIMEASRPPEKEGEKKKMTMDEARLRAMLENAKESTWTENLDNAVQAQEQFMLPGRKQDVPDFMTKIDHRGMEIMKKQHDAIEKEKKRKKRKLTTKFWSS